MSHNNLKLIVSNHLGISTTSLTYHKPKAMDLHKHSSCKDSASGCTKRSADELDKNDNHTTNPKKSRFDSQDDDNRQNFNKLPDEVKCLIFQNLTFNDLMSATLVCKSWSDTIDSNKELTEKILFNLPIVISNELNEVTPIKRRYVHIKADKLPKTTDYERKFMSIKNMVKSIVLKVHDGDSYSDLCDFLEQFVSLRSIEIIEINVDTNFLATPDDIRRAINLSGLESLTIRANMQRFIRIVLHATWNNVQLKTFKLTDSSGFSNRVYLETVDLNTSQKLAKFLNLQCKLKVLEITNFNLLICASAAQDLELKFKLKTLTLRRSGLFLVSDSDDFENDTPNHFTAVRKLLQSCHDTCETLSFAELPTEFNATIVECLVEFTKLKILKISFHYRNNDTNRRSIAYFLSTRKMKCQLQKLFISGSQCTTKNADVWSLLRQQKDSLETLILTCPMPCYSNIWNYIASEMKVKTLCARFTKTTMTGMGGNSLETLVNIGDPLRNVDETFWRRFRKRNPNFKSMRAMPFDVALKKFW